VDRQPAAAPQHQPHRADAGQPVGSRAAGGARRLGEPARRAESHRHAGFRHALRADWLHSPGWRPAGGRWDGEYKLADGGGFFEELKRRHVWRVAIAYAVVAWLLVQVATQVFPFFNIPDWTVRLVVILIAIGFPIAVIFAWVYELTPEGIRRTAPADSPEA